MNDYPIDLENDPFRIEYFSPCFKRFMTVDMKTREFVVRKTKSEHELFRIPKDLLTV